ncbi:MAG TPA: hypothetical protein RMH85_03740 [Polyangiaceae bacterium LLY-WYZ-15_(1-7)]|nr:hypothetical protein [Myxococcales bacterium]MAT28434.1 hypothetical protein [Sandaracinus sp.]HJK93097.1 hypothetical protein [Polyangiaceae bacterium LLY-WYZ-15_(1-7)]MBJ70401.1 hypothetical protein [Sandaracinus sp.]HJL03843.1 hypothetical protein [Polyangiaceae bacterium LLY-WYZ-15_(1-7)]
MAEFDTSDATQATLPPFVEVELVYETGHPGMDTTPWRAFEIWTRNRIYSCDWRMRCIEVLARASGEPDPKHPLLGARLAGGQVQQDDAIEVTSPCPRPGCEAVFEHPKAKGYVTTSTVSRVVLRLRVLTVPQKRIEPTWDDLTESWRR